MTLISDYLFCIGVIASIRIGFIQNPMRMPYVFLVMCYGKDGFFLKRSLIGLFLAFWVHFFYILNVEVFF